MLPRLSLCTALSPWTNSPPISTSEVHLYRTFLSAHGGLLIPSPSALALCSTLPLFLSFKATPPFFSCNKTKKVISFDEFNLIVCLAAWRAPLPREHRHERVQLHHPLCDIELHLQHVTAKDANRAAPPPWRPHPAALSLPPRGPWSKQSATACFHSIQHVRP